MNAPHRQLLALTALTGLACGQKIRGIETAPVGAIIVAELPPDAVVVDARTAEEWAAGHVPGAAQLHWTEVTGMDDNGLWGLRPSDEVAALLAKRGVPDDRPVAIYGGGPEGWGDDGNLYWTLRYLGHDDVVVLDGGYLGWLSGGGEPSTDDDAPAPTDFSPQVVDEVLATSEQVADWDGVLLDVRSREEWEAGRIPGAVFFPWDSVYAKDGTLREEQALADAFAEVGVTADTPVATYCAAGIRAGHTFLVLEALGVTEVRNYLGSWTRWTAEGRPVEQ